MSHEWGNYPKNFVPKMYWGARAILERQSGYPGKALCLLYDRQCFEQLEGSQRNPDTFFDWINEKVLSELRRFARENRFYEWSDLVTIQSEDGIFTCQATPKGSGGEYLYIGCWEVNLKRNTIAHSIPLLRGRFQNRMATRLSKSSTLISGSIVKKLTMNAGATLNMNIL